MAITITAPAFKLISGFNPEMGVTQDLLTFEPGFLSHSDGTHFVSSADMLGVDMKKVGVGGCDVPVVNGAQYSPYVVEDASGKPGIIMSRARFFTQDPTQPEFVAVPAGWTLARKLPFGLGYNALWGGLPNFHLSAWPGLPWVRLTDAGYGSPWTQGPIATGANTWADVDLSGYIPDNARMAYLAFETRCVGATAGSGYARSWAGQQRPVWLGSASPTQPSTPTTMWLRVDSARHIQVNVTPGCEIFVQMLGYQMTEPS